MKTRQKLQNFSLATYEWTYLQELRDFLKPFADLTVWISKDDCPSAGSVFAIYERLMEILEGNPIL